MSNLRMDFGIDLDQGITMYRNSMQAAFDAFTQKGFVAAQMPTYTAQNGQQIAYHGELPKDLTVLTDDQLGFYMGLLSEWNAFVQFQLAEASAALSEAKEELALTEAKLRITYKYDEEDKKRTIQEKDDCVKIDQRFVTARAQVIYRETFFLGVKAIAFSAEQAFNAISRRITQRGQEAERTRRDGNINQTNIPVNGPLFRRG